MRPQHLRLASRLATEPNREDVHEAIRAEVAKCDAEVARLAGLTLETKGPFLPFLRNVTTEDAREKAKAAQVHARYVLRQTDAGRLSDDDWKTIANAMHGES